MRYWIKKIVQLLLTLLLISVITFIAFSIIPGDPARMMLGINATTEQVDLLRAEMGLDRPLIVQFFSWLFGAMTGNLGNSVRFGQSVVSLIGERLFVTLGLGMISLTMTLVFSFPLGLLCARRPGGVVDTVISVTNHTFVSIPPFVMGLLLTLLLGFAFRLFVAGNFVPYDESIPGFIISLLVPSLAIALPKVAMTVKFVRTSLLSEKNKDYVRTAQSHGLSDAVVMRRHVLPNALVPVLTIIAIISAEIMGGSLIIEQTFNLPGLGRLLLQAIFSNDLPLIAGITLYLSTLVVLIHFAMDIIYGWIDPRLRFN